MDKKQISIEHLEYGSQDLDVEDKERLRSMSNDIPANHLASKIEQAEARRIVRKIDFRLVPLLAFLFLIVQIDRTNIGNANIAGMPQDLHLTGPQFNIAVSIFFVPYALLEVPSNIVLKILRPSIWISILCFSWGTVMTLMGIVSNRQGLYICRVFLGVFESGFFPAAMYLLTIWYQRYEVQRRMSVVFAAAPLAGAFSGLLAYAIEHMDGIAGFGGWRWIFILEGLFPVAFSFILYFILPDSPETANFLTKPEREFLVNRVALQNAGNHSTYVTNTDKIQWRYIKAAFLEWKTWASVIPYLSSTTGVYGFTATVPTVIQQLGYTSTNAQLMTIPVYLAATITTLIVGWLSDRIKQRTPFIMGCLSIAVIGFVAELAIPHPKFPGVTYFFLFFITVGLFSPVVSIITLTANNVAPSSKRAVGMAIMMSFGNLGGVCGSNIYLAYQKPKYQTGFGVSLGFCVAGIIMAAVLRVAYRRENDKRDELLAREGEERVRARFTDQELLEMGDRSPFFRYTL
ncbi:hypothetical protein BP5796_12257 [Coleophoma crateriformis]|uniref:Major facilitator superfamily (MFS) profile domain-containing protein n=1 Tax=Coleophoma crateriformis TaxID=565419 RepID=A0A3D8Q9J0_9HELO|nr:hypothetical protein BP5796_12257 [Coleophoma crateriformis]